MSEKQTFEHIVYYTEGNNLVMERKFKAPRAAVFKAYSDSALIEAWWGPEGWKTKNTSFEFKQNGVWHYCMTCTDENQGDFLGRNLGDLQCIRKWLHQKSYSIQMRSQIRTEMLLLTCRKCRSASFSRKKASKHFLKLRAPLLQRKR